MMEFVNGKDDIPEILWKNPKLFETTNQIWIFLRPCGSTDNKIQFTNGCFLGLGAPIIIGLVNLFNQGWGKKHSIATTGNSMGFKQLTCRGEITTQLYQLHSGTLT